MHGLVRSIRLAGISAAACLTVLSGLALVWFFVQPETLPLLSTWQLAVILGAFVLPGLCLAAWHIDRRAAARAPRRRTAAPRTTPGQSLVGNPLPPVAENPVASARIVAPTPARAEPPVPGRRSPAGRSIRADRSVHRHRRSARV